MVRPGPKVARIIQGVVLGMAGALASLGTTFGCLVRNLIVSPDAYAYNLPGLNPETADLHGHFRGTGIGEMAITVILALLMLTWLWAVFVFIRQEPRSWLTWILAAPIGASFLWLCHQAWMFAYPVCEAV